MLNYGKWYFNGILLKKLLEKQNHNTIMEGPGMLKEENFLVDSRYVNHYDYIWQKGKNGQIYIILPVIEEERENIQVILKNKNELHVILKNKPENNSTYSGIFFLNKDKEYEAIFHLAEDYDHVDATIFGSFLLLSVVPEVKEEKIVKATWK
ncbi:MAG: hypothetical protein N3A54_02580 [Patescibacteria group bacterium]|nr:hypothetical protein [Patescibacteria group bacterium]